MNYQDYDEYMRSLMGYPSMRTSMNQPMNPGMTQFSNMDACADDLERMYPETYRVIYPMVCFACDNIRTPVTEETVDMMTDDIYDRDLVKHKLDIFLHREYEPDGKGGLFYIRDCAEDLREVEIWAQLCWYLDKFV